MIQWWHVYNPHLKKHSDRQIAQNDAMLLNCLFLGLVGVGVLALVILVMFLLYI